MCRKNFTLKPKVSLVCFGFNLCWQRRNSGTVHVVKFTYLRFMNQLALLIFATWDLKSLILPCRLTYLTTLFLSQFNLRSVFIVHRQALTESEMTNSQYGQFIPIFPFFDKLTFISPLFINGKLAISWQGRTSKVLFWDTYPWIADWKWKW